MNVSCMDDSCKTSNLPASAPVLKCAQRDKDLICHIDPTKSKSIGTLRMVALFSAFFLVQVAYYTFCFCGLLYNFATGSATLTTEEITVTVVFLFIFVSVTIIAFMHQARTKKRRVGYYTIAAMFVIFGISLYAMILEGWNFWAPAIEIYVDSIMVHSYPVGLLFMIGLTSFVLAWYSLAAEYQVKQEGLEACTIISVPDTFTF